MLRSYEADFVVRYGTCSTTVQYGQTEGLIVYDEKNAATYGTSKQDGRLGCDLMHSAWILSILRSIIELS